MKVMSPLVACRVGLNCVVDEVISPTRRKRKNIIVHAAAMLIPSCGSISSTRSEIAACTSSFSMCLVIGVLLVSSFTKDLLIPLMQEKYLL